MSNLTLRILTAVIAIPIVIAICMIGGFVFFGFIAIVSAVALSEFYALARNKGALPIVRLGILAGFFVNLSFFHSKLQPTIVTFFSTMGISVPFPTQAQLLQITLLVTVVVVLLLEMFRNRGSALLNISATLMGIVYVPLFLGTLIGLREVFNPMDFPMLRYSSNVSSFSDPSAISEVYRWGGLTVVSVLATIWICDTAAFHIGSVMGKHKLFPRVSPNKSWEGAVAGFIAAIAAAVAAKFLVLSYLPLGSAVVIGMIVGLFGQLGDLVESLLKRDAGVKDSSGLIPGHGGVLDRFDSLLLVAPLVYLYLDYVLFS